MPIKTLNNNGLKVYEETEDYFIQIDKDVVITTVEKYVPGTFDIYNERLKDVERSRELLSLHKITWDANIDNAKLLLDVNKEQLERLANTPVLLPDEEARPALKTRAIPTNYLCCFRVDKKTGEMYNGEGYENLVGSSFMPNNIEGSIVQKDGGYFEFEVIGNSEAYPTKYVNVMQGGFSPDTTYSFNWDLESNNFQSVVFFPEVFDAKVDSDKLKGTDTLTSIANITYPGRGLLIYLRSSPNIGDYIKGKVQITRTSTEKPFVKTIMPNGKMEFLSGATELTHTFLNKGDGVITFGSGSFSLKGERTEQLLVYKGLLTEQEKQAELAKTIRLR